LRAQPLGYAPGVEIGYALSCEEHRPLDLVRHAARAEDAGFAFSLISDHFHPWIDRQGQSAFVWSVLGGIAAETESMRVGTGVTCPLIRVHPAIVAQAAATTAALLPGRFFLGLGTGENLNEHVLGDRWPSTAERREMLEEAIAVIRRLWEGDLCSFEGKHYRVVDARVYTLPEEAVPIVVAAGGPEAAGLAGRVGDGLVSTDPDEEIVRAYREAGGDGPTYGMLTVCWAASEAQARATALEWWPNAGLKGTLGQELPLPSHFEQAAAMVDEDVIAQVVVCGPDPAAHLEGIRRFTDAGYDHVYIHQVGPDQDGFIDFYADELLDAAGRLEPAAPRVAA
jgi:coenzyme F420-dependent glucose-6-phosphate dehydrogenase